MSEEREYIPGDVVRMELHVENDGANLDNAFARFVHEGDPAGQCFADSYEIDPATRVATRQLNRKARPWVWGRPPKPPRYRRPTFVYCL